MLHLQVTYNPIDHEFIITNYFSNNLILNFTKLKFFVFVLFYCKILLGLWITCPVIFMQKPYRTTVYYSTVYKNCV